MKLDLETLKQVKFTFDIHSDHSIMCNGYRSLCRMIEEAEKEVNENFVQPDVIKSVCDKCRFKNECRFIEMNTEQNCKYFIDEQTVL